MKVQAYVTWPLSVPGLAITVGDPRVSGGMRQKHSALAVLHHLPSEASIAPQSWHTPATPPGSHPMPALPLTGQVTSP